jgi:hypothetical protein
MQAYFERTLVADLKDELEIFMKSLSTTVKHRYQRAHVSLSSPAEQGARVDAEINTLRRCKSEVAYTDPAPVFEARGAARYWC